MKEPNPIRIGFAGFEGINSLDLAGPAEAFASTLLGEERLPGYDVTVLAATRAPFTAESGVTLLPSATFADGLEFDTIIVPGGPGIRLPHVAAPVAGWVLGLHQTVRRIVTVCTGVYGIAVTGLLHGRRVTTHWSFCKAFAREYPGIHVDPKPLFVKDGKFYTSAGVTAGIDLALALIEEDYGSVAALAVARDLVVYLKRPGGQEQFSEPLRFQAQSPEEFDELVAWICGNLHGDLSVEALARRVGSSPRNFSRRFRRAFGRTPGDFVEDLRLGEARQRLGAPRATVEEVASSVGFRSADTFRRSFERRFRITPSAYRGRFPISEIKLPSP